MTCLNDSINCERTIYLIRRKWFESTTKGKEKKDLFKLMFFCCCCFCIMLYCCVDHYFPIFYV